MNGDKPPVNIRLLAILVGGGLAVLLLVIVLHHFQVRRQIGISLEQARAASKAAKETEDFDEKLIELKKSLENYQRYLGVNRNDLDVLEEEGLMLIDFAEAFGKNNRSNDAGRFYVGGLQCLEKVLRADPKRTPLRLKVAQGMLTVGRGEDAIANLAFLATTPANAEELQKFFDRNDLWSRAKSIARMDDDHWRDTVLSKFMRSDEDVVNREELLVWLDESDDLWMVLEDPELLSLLSQCYIQLKEPELAEAPLKQAVLLDPNVPKYYFALANLLLTLGRNDDADYWMSEMVSVNPDSFEARQIRSQYRTNLISRVEKKKAVLLAQQALWDATESIRQAIEQAAEKVEAGSPTSQNAKDLRAASDSLHETMPRNRETITPPYRDAILEAAKRLKQLSEELPGIADEVKAVGDGLMLASAAELSIGRTSEKKAEEPHLKNARLYSTTAVELFPQKAQSYLILASIEREMGDPEKAIEWLRQGSSLKDNRSVMLWQMANLLISAGRLDEARKIIPQLEEEGTAKPFLTHLESMILFSEKNWAEAKAGFEGVLPELSNMPENALQVNLLIAECCEQLGLIDQQREALARAALLDRSSVKVLLDLAKAEAASGQLDQAIEDYRRVLRFSNSPEITLLLARALLVKQLGLPKSERNWIEVTSVIKKGEALSPQSPQMALLRAELLTAQDKPREAVTLLSETRTRLMEEIRQIHEKYQQAKKEADALTGQAKEEKQAESESLGIKLMQNKSIQATLWQTLLRLAERQKNWEGANQVLLAAETELGDGARTRLMKGQNLVQRYGREAAPQLRELLKGTEEFSQSEQLQLWQGFAMLAYQARDHKMAEELCRRILEAKPDDLEVQRLRFQIAAAESDVVAMEKILNQIKRIEGKPSAFWCYADAMRLSMLADKGAGRKALLKSLEQLKKAGTLRPQWAQVSILAAMVYERLGDEETAVKNYLEAIELGADDPQIIRRAAQLLIQKNRLREADRMFRLLAERRPLLSDEFGREMRDVKAALGEFDAAIDPARDVAAKSQKFEDHVWLGQLLSVAGRKMQEEGRQSEADTLLAEAEDTLRHAVILKSDTPEPWVALIQYYGQSDQPEKAEKTIAQARLKLSPAVAATALGQCYEVLGQSENAAKQYEIAIENAPKDPEVARRAALFYFRIGQPEKAKAELMRIIREGTDANQEQKAQARREMAFALLEEGGLANRQAALQWVETNLAENPSSATDQHLRAVIWSEDSMGSHHQEAIASLKNLLARQPGANPKIRFTLAQLYYAEENWREYKSQMEKLLETHRDVPQYVRSYASALMQKGDYQEAEHWTSELEKIAPNDIATVIMRAELSFRRRQYDRARILLGNYLDDPKSLPAKRETRLAIVAGALEGFAKRLRADKEFSLAKDYSKEAHEYFREYVALDPRRDLLMASFLARQDRLDEAIDLIDALRETSDPGQIAMACFNVIDGTGASPQQITRVDQILQKTSKQYPNDPVPQIAIAVICNMQERYDEAEAIYREILKKSPDNPTVLNNLAVLLAQQGIKLDEAHEMINLAIQKTGATDDLLDSRAIVLLELNKPQEALEDLRKAIAQKPSAIRYLHQAQAFNAIKQRRAAIGAFKKALDMGLEEGSLQGPDLRTFKRLKHELL